MEGFLLGLGFIGLVLAILTPNSKWGVAAMLTSFIAYFTLAETVDWFPVVLFMLGIGLVIFELFIPDFGLAGLFGTIILSAGVYLTLGDLVQTIRDLTLVFFLTGTAIVVLIRNGYSFQNLSKLVLNTHATSPQTLLKKGALATSISVGAHGEAATPLRPSGKAYFGEKQNHLLDVLSESGFIAAGSTVEIIKVNGSKIIVRSVDQYEQFN